MGTPAGASWAHSLLRIRNTGHTSDVVVSTTYYMKEISQVDIQQNSMIGCRSLVLNIRALSA